MNLGMKLVKDEKKKAAGQVFTSRHHQLPWVSSVKGRREVDMVKSQ